MKYLSRELYGNKAYIIQLTFKNKYIEGKRTERSKKLMLI